jgi:transcriptional regulator with XRE-family HTH domain
MQDDQVRQMDRTDGSRRPTAHEARRRWADEVTQALNEQRLSIHAAAKAVGISPGRLQAWLSQDVEPSPRAMNDLARVIGRQHLYLMELLDWLPPDLSDVPLRLEATAKLREAMADARRWLEGASNLVGMQGGRLAASALLEASDDWETILRHSIRGDRHRVRYSTYVALSRVNAPDANAKPAPPQDTLKDRDEIERLIASTILRTSAGWVSPDRLGSSTWFKRPDLVLSAPVLCASNPRGLRPNLLVPPSILVVGIPFAGGQEVGALLAGTLEWAYFELAATARQQFGLDSTSLVQMDRAQAEIARGLLEDPEGTGRLTVWSYSGLKPMLQTFREIQEDLPLVVLLKAPDSLLDYVTKRLELEDSPDVDLVETAQNVVRRTLLTRRDPQTYKVIEIPDLAIPPGDGRPEEADLLFDVYVDLAFQAAEWLQEHHGGPALDTAPGVLGELWRKARTADLRPEPEQIG